MPSRQKLAAGIGPPVLFGTRHVHGPRGDQGDQQVRVDRQFRFVIAELLIVRAVPDSRQRIGCRHRFAIAPPGQRGSSLAGVVRDHQRESLVLCSRPQGCLAGSRVPEHGHSVPVDRRVGLQIVQRAAQSPGPGTDGTPLVVGQLSLSACAA